MHVLICRKQIFCARCNARSLRWNRLWLILIKIIIFTSIFKVWKNYTCSRGPFAKKMSFISSLSNFFCSSTKHLLFMLLSKFTLNAVVGGLYGKNYHHASLVRISYCLPTLNLQPVCVLYQTTRNMHCMLAFINVTKF